MAATAIVSGRRIYCDGTVGKLVVQPFKTPLLVALPFVALTPLSIAASMMRGARLTTAGWVIMIAYALIALLLVARIVLAPPRVEVDFHTKRVVVGKDDLSFEEAKAKKLVALDFLGPSFEAAMRGEPATDLEKAVDKMGSEYAKALIMRLVLLVAPGLMFAYAAVF